MDEMYFEAHLPGEIQMDNADGNYTPEEFVQFIQANSMFDDYTLVGRMEDARLIYMLYRRS